MQLLAEIGPQFVGQTLIAVLAITLTLAAGHIDVFIDGADDLGNADLSGGTRQTVPPTGTAHTLDQTGLAQLGKELFEIGKGNALTLGNIRQRYRTGFIMYREIQHGGEFVLPEGVALRCALQFDVGIQWLHLIGVGLLASVGQLLMTRAYSHAPASQISHYSYSSILYASLIGWLLWEEWMDGWAWFGAGLVALSGILLIRRRPVTLSADEQGVASPAATAPGSDAPAGRSPPV